MKTAPTSTVVVSLPLDKFATQAVVLVMRPTDVALEKVTVSPATVYHISV